MFRFTIWFILVVTLFWPVPTVDEPIRQDIVSPMDDPPDPPTCPPICEGGE